MRKYPICAYRMAKADYHTWRFERAWKRNGNAFMREMIANTPPRPPFKQRWREWLAAYDARRAALEGEK
jgi:hypothetical protein